MQLGIWGKVLQALLLTMLKLCLASSRSANCSSRECVDVKFLSHPGVIHVMAISHPDPIDAMVVSHPDVMNVRAIRPDVTDVMAVSHLQQLHSISSHPLALSTRFELDVLFRTEHSSVTYPQHFTNCECFH